MLLKLALLALVLALLEALLLEKLGLLLLVK
jgi:hypothetical protein